MVLLASGDLTQAPARFANGLVTSTDVFLQEQLQYVQVGGSNLRLVPVLLGLALLVAGAACKEAHACECAVLPIRLEPGRR